jgi:Rrf2 family protein
MRITRSEEYGLRLVIRLASAGGRLSIRELADSEQLPETTVAKVIGRLRRSGVVTAERGRNGGYSLSARPEEITVAQVVESFDARVYDPAFCQRMSPGDDACAHSTSCGLRPIWRGLTSVIGEFLAGITVADVVARSMPRPHETLPMVTGQRLTTSPTGRV